jgi:hypothetical protein
MSQAILAITEQLDGSFKNISFEVISAGRKLAGKAGVPLIAAVMGAGSRCDCRADRRIWGGADTGGRP